MHVVDLLNQLRFAWIERVSHGLARGESVRQSFLDQLGQFYDLMGQAVFSGNPAWMNTLFDRWAEARTQSELEKSEASLAPLLNEILLATFEIASEKLDSDEAMRVVGAVLPIFGHAFQYTTQQEARLHIDHISKDLERARVTLEQLDKSKSDFISVAAHELKTPLTLIEGYSMMLREQFPEEDQASQPVLLLKGIDNGTRRLRDIIDDMIDVSLIDNSMLQINFQPVWINQLLNIAKRELTEVMVDRRQTLVINRFPGSEQMTFGDAERLYQAFRNLLTNAIKYTPDGGTITVDGRQLPGFIEVMITDTGIGIDEDDHERIFEKFGRLGNAQLHSSGKTKFKGGGPGLGLPITKGLIEAHGGAIWVESDGYDEVRCPGSTFHVILPVRKEAPDEKTKKLFQPLSEMNTIALTE